MTMLPRFLTALLISSTLTTAPLQAAAQSSDRPITAREPDVEAIAKTPITDLNLSRTEIPALLVEAETRPYSLENIKSCAQLIAAVKELDKVLGPDIDLPRTERSRINKGRLAQWAVGTFIPFRTLIREFSGANRQQREIADAIQAGIARRGFLKGVGATRECAYPASPATEAIIAEHIASMEQEEATKVDNASKPDKAQSKSKTLRTNEEPARKASNPPSHMGPVFTSEPIVQPIP